MAQEDAAVFAGIERDLVKKYQSLYPAQKQAVRMHMDEHFDPFRDDSEVHFNELLKNALDAFFRRRVLGKFSRRHARQERRSHKKCTRPLQILQGTDNICLECGFQLNDDIWEETLKICEWCLGEFLLKDIDFIDFEDGSAIPLCPRCAEHAFNGGSGPPDA